MIQLPRESDFTELSELISASIRGCIDASEVDIRNIERSSIEASRKFLDGHLDGVHLLYRDSNQIQGLILVKDYWNMVSLFVLPALHRKGIATKLVQESLKVCREKSPKKLLALNSSNYASKFYSVLGFERNGEPLDFPGGCIPYVYRF